MNDQNERRLETLSGQVSSLKNVTYDIYSRANDYTRIDRATESFSGLSNSVKKSTENFFRVVRSAGRRRIMTMVLAIVGSILIIYYASKWFF
ncbi:Protein transport protein sft1 [Schizosaccharomyces pombe]|uniref:Protein transport protein sft1 n=1 Tax=Schizosaccharomyces pombe (strain 972 / ATCC 24843) TaxID=284812 RepID=SFT1_SCHPO|nr:putative SNARE protein Sft1 [Schizosaccharomyces pombe]Q09730.1 RecName: Full=Protein transport protein sft1 [Schizosaccharomyces pombe 972h-]CAA90471.1 SNARE Sft1 (predicted) [Schizosaccharomyces pombe]|eukprot:NP_592925.1 putative SNARE protein Sft1 [Schizosaccharomyces pombe]